MLVNISLVRQEVAILMNECFVRYRKLNVLIFCSLSPFIESAQSLFYRFN
jgi:hypothetical protein